MSGEGAEAPVTSGGDAREAQHHHHNNEPSHHPQSSSRVSSPPTTGYGSHHDASAYGTHHHAGLLPGHSDSITGHIGAGFVQPSSYLRPRGQSRPMTPKTNLNIDDPVDREQLEGLRAIRAFLKVRTSYDVLPLSYRLILLDSSLLVKKSLNILTQNGIVSAPLWDSRTSTFAGLLTTSDYINVIQYYWQNQHLADQVDQFRLNSLRDVEKAIGVAQIETVSIHPERPLYEACRKMLKSRARRIPLVDIDDETQRAMVVSVITQYRILKFIAVNNKRELEMLSKPLREVNVGTYEGLATARMETPVIDVIHMLSRRGISSVPILDDEDKVTNVFESVDVLPLLTSTPSKPPSSSSTSQSPQPQPSGPAHTYPDLTLTIGDALLKRSPDFPGIYTCSIHDSLAGIMDTVRKSRVHRFVVIDEESRLRGMVTLSDILEYILLEGERGEGVWGEDEGRRDGYLME